MRHSLYLYEIQPSKFLKAQCESGQTLTKIKKLLFKSNPFAEKFAIEECIGAAKAILSDSPFYLTELHCDAAVLLGEVLGKRIHIGELEDVKDLEHVKKLGFFFAAA